MYSYFIIFNPSSFLDHTRKMFSVHPSNSPQKHRIHSVMIDSTISGEEASNTITASIAYAINLTIQHLKLESFINNQAQSSNSFPYQIN